jgi:3-isopropylmalate/(R)-2-methylmalate dehydratase small subunit
MTGEFRLKGRLWVLIRDGELLDDIDTDMIYHNAHLAVTEISEMGQYAFGNLQGFEEFATRAGEGDLVLAGENFGSGSSRQHAVDCFRALGVKAVLARSFGAIYKRNAINSGFPIMEVPGIPADLFDRLETVEVDLEKGTIDSGGKSYQGREMSPVARDIYLCGDLFAYAETLN